jgi:hypothetical protein
MAFLMNTTRDVNPANDPGDMEALMMEFRKIAWTDDEREPICDAVLAVSLRRGSFDLHLALDYLVAAAYPDALQVPFTSTPGQEKHAMLLLGWEDRPLAPRDPAALPVQIEALRDFGIQDEKGNPFCDEVLVIALRTSFYDVNLAAELLLEAGDQRMSWTGCCPHPERDDALTQLKWVFQGLPESTVSDAYYDASRRWRPAVFALVEVESQLAA